MNTHVYLLTENLSLDPNEWLTVVELTDALERHGESQPAFNNHKRTRPDGDALISESLFNPNSINCSAIRARVGVALGIAVGQLDVVEDVPTFGNVPSTRCTVSQTGVDLVQMTVFAGAQAAWKSSRLEALAYLKANKTEWEGAV